ncbi:hypothetical protein [Brevibacillus sp. AY1]|uniref:hypothetical protein n=1 Tax=Brevibacillus sp. AY1 TaxID=2807621 RepID=UPI0024573637|nr:hypothetical protein [Brevibacillus sp. AY1]MDH4616590.1 hypothetical protein [Brevibacillus sp. AY1]
MKFKTTWVKSGVVLGITSVALLSSIYFTSNTFAEKSKLETYDLTQTEFVQPKSKIEYIRFDHNDGTYDEHWRDVENKQERHDKYTKDGELINRIIVLDSGKRVISIGNEGGELEAYTWELPSKDAAENNNLLQISLIKETKDKLKDKKWKLNKSAKLNSNVSVDEIESLNDDTKEIVRLDSETGIPLEREIYEIKNGKEEKVLTETYQFIDDSSDLFDVDIKAKEVPADDIVVEKE